MKKTSVIVASLFSALLRHCTGHGGPQDTMQIYGSHFDPQRIEVGLPPVDTTWEVSSDEWGIEWRNRHYVDTLPYYSSKSDYIQSRGLIRETDIYYSGRKYETFDGSGSEEVIVTYFFKDDPKASPPGYVGWHCSYHHSEATMIDAPVSIDSATLVLKRWGIKRLPK